MVLPHPLGPTMEKNSLFSTWKLTSCSARTGSPLIETWTLLTSLTLTCAIPGARYRPWYQGMVSRATWRIRKSSTRPSRPIRTMPSRM